MTQMPISDSANTAAGAAAKTLPGWFARHLDSCQTDFEQRVVLLPEYAQWRPTDLPGVELRIMEFVASERSRLSAQLRFSEGHQPAVLGNILDLELLIQRGALLSALGSYSSGMYFRLPEVRQHELHNLEFRCATASKPEQHAAQANQALVYVAAGQMLESDTEPRQIDTQDHSRWLPGPVDNTEVLPLHGHGTGNVMMIRWTGTMAFKPKIDPLGEELLVLHGALHDSHGHYPAGTWIRNPVRAWQAWGAKAGTVVYYKNGHFPS